jgi:hypothetical protein
MVVCRIAKLDRPDENPEPDTGTETTRMIRIKQKTEEFGDGEEGRKEEG